MGLDARKAAQVVCRLVETRAIPFCERDGEQLTGVGKGPPMVSTLESTGIALGLQADSGAAVCASVHEGADIAIRVAGHDDRTPSHCDAFEIVGVRYLGGMQQKNPGATKNLGHLALENGRVSEYRTVHHAIRPHQMVEPAIFIARQGLGRRAAQQGLEIGHVLPQTTFNGASSRSIAVRRSASGRCSNRM